MCTRVAAGLEAAQLAQGQLRFLADGVRSVEWAPAALPGDAPKTTICSLFEQTQVDLRRDGIDDLVIRTRFCMKGKPSDSLYVFPADSDVLARASWQDLGPLHETQDKIEHTGGVYVLSKLMGAKQPVELRGVFALDVVRVDEQALVALTAPPFHWVVVGRLRGTGALDDVCYLKREG